MNDTSKGTEMNGWTKDWCDRDKLIISLQTLLSITKKMIDTKTGENMYKWFKNLES